MTSDLDQNDTHTLRRAEALKRIRALGHLLDNAVPIPGSSYRVGLDPLLGLIPGAGDVVSLVLSAYIVIEAARFKLSASTLFRMVLNILLEAVVGTVPLLGDAVDFVWKANAQNLALLETHLNDPQPNQAADKKFIVIAFIILAALVIGAIALMVLILHGIIALLSG
ncbi:MAG: DUF4112 domain-containing protein [Elainellaceae cyanobacterium]